VLFYLLTGGTLLQEKASIHMYVPDANGLEKEAPVRVNGIGVGKVEKIGFSGSNDPHRVVRIDMQLALASLTAIPADSYAAINSDTLIGDKIVDITSGRSPSRLRPGSEIAFNDQPDMLKKIDIQQLEANLREVEKQLTEIENGTSPVGKFFKDEALHQKMLQKVKDLDQKMREATASTGEIGQFIYTDTLYRKFHDPLIELDLSLAKLQSGQGNLGQFLRDPAQYEKLRSDIGALRQQVAGVGSGSFLQSEAAYEGWIRTIDNLTRQVDQVNANDGFGTAATYDNLVGAAKEFRDTVKDFRENPRKYLRIKLF